MKLEMSPTNRVVLAMLVIAALATAFWILLLSPKREEAAALGVQMEGVEASLVQHEAEAAEGEDARRKFPQDYQQLVVLGKAVPGDDDTASLLVQVNRIAKRAEVTFEDLKLVPGSSGAEVPAPAPEGGGEPVSATEAAASLLPLGATVGPAGLGVMPYSLTFKGDFFEIADFIDGLDSLVKSGNANVGVDGRLITIDGFSLQADSDAGFPALEASFSVTTYLTPPSQGVTGGATPEAPASETGTPVSATVGATP